jgi:hypothetical protein
MRVILVFLRFRRGIIYFGVFIGMEDYSKMTRLWVDRAIYDTPDLDDGFTNCG